MLLLLARLLLASSTQLSRLPPLFGGTEKVSRRDAVGLPESLVAVSPGQEEAAMWFAARASRESREVTLDEMVYNSLCSRISCDRPLDPVTIHSSIWNCTFQALEDPVDGLVSCAQRAVRRGVGVTRYQLEDMVKRACTGRPCSKRLQKPLTFHLTPIGLLTVEPWEEPAEVVEKFARTLAFGSPMARDVALLIVDWFCSRRECRRHVHEDIAVTVDGALYECSYWEPPEVAVTRSTDDVEVAKALLQYYCERKECGWRLERTLELKVWSYANSSVGTLRCGMLEDPADCVETFVRKSLSNFGGVRLLDNDEDDLTRAMEMMMAWLCRRRYCSRALAPEIQLGEVVARPWEEPWKVVATYAKQNRAVSEESMRSIYSDICRHRYFCANLPQHVGVSFDGVGNITCRSWEQPADVVESFAYQAVHAGHVLRASDLQYTLDLICSQRHCARNKLSVVATALVMHPGKTAGRALATALRSVPNIFVLGHDAKCGDDSRPCFVVLRHPLDRFVSALAFKKQGTRRLCFFKFSFAEHRRRMGR